MNWVADPPGHGHGLLFKTRGDAGRKQDAAVEAVPTWSTSYRLGQVLGKIWLQGRRGFTVLGTTMCDILSQTSESIMRTKLLTSLAVAVVFGNAPLFAQDNNLARMYLVTPKQGMAAQFETALRDHAGWRAANGDPWTWNVYAAETGDDLGVFVIRSGNHSWADFDAYDASFAMQGLVHWNATVAPLVGTISSGIWAMDVENSSLPAEPMQPAFVNVTTFHLRPGMEQQFIEMVNQASEILKGHGWTNFLWESPVSGGGPGPTIDLATLHPNWADMAEPDPDFATIMIQEMGQDGFGEWMSGLGETYRGVESMTVRHRPDMSVPGN